MCEIETVPLKIKPTAGRIKNIIILYRLCVLTSQMELYYSVQVIRGYSGYSARPSPAATMVEVGRDKKNPDEFAMALDETLGDFAFPDEFVFDVWGAIGDAKQGRF